MTPGYCMELLKVLCGQIRETVAALGPHTSELPEWQVLKLSHLAAEVRSFQEAVFSEEQVEQSPAINAKKGGGK